MSTEADGAEEDRPGQRKEPRHDGGVLWLAGVDPDIAILLERSDSPLRWVAEEPVPGLSVRKCIERLVDRE